MAHITKEELLKIARISHIDIRQEEIAPLQEQLDNVLSYAVRVKEIAIDIPESSTKNVNTFRDDVITRADAQAILSLAPEQEENYFVVPKILDSNA